MHSVARLSCLVVVLSFGCDASCNIGGKLDGKKIEAKIRSDLEGDGGVLKNVTCPASIKKKKGALVACDVVAENGDLLKIVFEQLDGKGNLAPVDDKSDGLVVMAKLEVAIAGVLKRDEATAKAGYGTVTCPADKKAATGGTFECSAMAGDRKAIVRVDENDDKGNVSYKVIAIEMPGATFATELVGELEKSKVKAMVDCGTAPVRLAHEKPFACSATDDKGQTAPIEVLPKGNTGAFQWRVGGKK